MYPFACTQHAWMNITLEGKSINIKNFRTSKDVHIHIYVHTYTLKLLQKHELKFYFFPINQLF